MVERILYIYDVHPCAESAIIFPRSSLRQALSADRTNKALTKDALSSFDSVAMIRALCS